jgi:hypothetical protein
VVGRSTKLALVLRAALASLFALPRTAGAPPARTPNTELSLYEAIILEEPRP